MASLTVHVEARIRRKWAAKLAVRLLGLVRIETKIGKRRIVGPIPIEVILGGEGRGVSNLSGNEPKDRSRSEPNRRTSEPSGTEAS